MESCDFHCDKARRRRDGNKYNMLWHGKWMSREVSSTEDQVYMYELVVFLTKEREKEKALLRTV
jgi:hypothetical protein